MASILKHLRSSTANKRPTASGLADGQIAINTASGTPALFFKDSASNIVKVGPAHVGTTAPNASPAGSAGNSTGELWVDNSLTTNGLKYYNGAAFVNLTPSGTTSTIGLVELATDAETQAGTDNVRVVTPSGLQSKVSDSTSTSSSTTIASSTAVKSAYDLANAALPKAGGTVTGAVIISPSGSLSFEGTTDDSFETTLAVVDPTADRTITLPNVTGTVITTGDSGTVTSTMIANDTIVDADINSAAAITLTKLGTGALPTTITVASGNIVDGTISNVEISASAAIADTKLDTISTADKVSLSALNIDGGTDIGAALADADLFIVDDGGAGTNRKAAATRITDYAFGKVSGDITITSSGVAAIGSGKVTSTMILDGTILNADVNASAAIAGTKISPDFGSQNTTTTGTSTAASFIPTSSTAPTNGVYLPSANNVAISTNGSGRLFVASTGSVGVGVSNPGYRLDIQDSMNIKIDGSNLARVFFNGTGTRISYADATGHLSLFTNSTERCYVGYGGGFSIISGGLNVSGGNIALSGGDRSIINNDANALILGTNGTERMRLDSSGRLGLGSSSPQAILDVAPDANRNLLVQGKAATTYGLELKNGSANSAGEFHVTAASSGSVVINRGSTEIARFNSTGLGIGTTSPGSPLTIESNAGNQVKITYPSVASYYLNATSGGDFAINKDGTERARIDTSGRLLVGTSSSRTTGIVGDGSRLQVEGLDAAGSFISVIRNVNTTGAGGVTFGKSRGTTLNSSTVVQSGDILGFVNFEGADGTNFIRSATITAEVDGTPGTGDMPGRLVFSTTADGASSPTERMRITSAGELLVGATATVGANRVFIAVGDQNALGIKTGQGAGNQNLVRFYDSTDTVCGVISIDSGANTTTYGTSSDYRLKQNIIKLANATTRLLALKPVNFNFIADDLNRVFDGFIAHEVETVVPEAVVGEKDGVDDQGSPVFQVIDQSKLVPLLTAALQETLAEIATLKDRVAALEAR